MYDAEVPLLIRDVVAMLIQVVLTLPLNIDKGKVYYFLLLSKSLL